MVKKAKKNAELEELLGPKQTMEFIWEQLGLLEAAQGQDVDDLYRQLRSRQGPDLIGLGHRLEADRDRTRLIMAALDSLDRA
jgi:hypothetical protein